MIGRFLPRLTLALALASISWPTQALCSYKGRENAVTTLSEEFADARMVVRAQVLDMDDHWSDESDSWTIYRLAIRGVYKGSPGKELRFFTFRNSGGFYLETGRNRHTGGEYLLFLNENGKTARDPAAITGTVSVNYPCGVSKEWKDVTTEEKQELLRLSRGER